LFHLKNRLKTRVALIELLNLSGIAVGNVGVPTCLREKSLQKKYSVVISPARKQTFAQLLKLFADLLHTRKNNNNSR
jgi:hypothetical protein